MVPSRVAGDDTVQLPVSESQSGADTSAAIESNLIENGSFERMANPCSPDGFYLLQGSDVGASFLCDGTTAVDGRYSMRVTTPANGTGLWFRPFPADISKAGKYELLLWAKAARAGVRLVFSTSSDPSSSCTLPEETVGFSLGMTWQLYLLHMINVIRATYTNIVIYIQILRTNVTY